MTPVAVQRFKRNCQAVKRAVEASEALHHLPPNSRVIIKPNIVIWINGPYPKWGVITTSVVMEETVALLRDHGVRDISIAEGCLKLRPGDREIGKKAFEGLGYAKLKQRYGVKLLDVWERPFETVDMGEGMGLKVNADLLASDFLVNLPVLKTHAQVRVSLGIKNLKGFLSVNSRKKCHGPDPDQDLDCMVAKLVKLLPPSATVIDGIYTLERGPSFDGKPRKTDLIIASKDPLAADMVGAKILGNDPGTVPYLAQAAREREMPTDLSTIQVIGERIEDVAGFHEFTFPYNGDNSLPIALEKAGVKGLKFHKYDSTLCTYCSSLMGMMLTLIALSHGGRPFEAVEFLTGKRMTPTPGMKKSVLVGQCMCLRNRDYPGSREIVEIKGCPPDPAQISAALKGIGIDADPSFFSNFEMAGAFMMERYKNKPEFDESDYTISGSE